MKRDERTRFFHVPPEDLGRERFFFAAGEARHITRSLRLGEGDIVTVVDGAGNGATARLFASDDRLGAVIEERFVSAVETAAALTLAVGLPKGAEMDEIVERGAELGVRRFLPFVAERTVRRGADRRERWEKIALSAMKLARAAIAPRVDPVGSLAEVVVAAAAHDRAFFLDRTGGPFPAARAGESALVVVGPEGGLVEGECGRLFDAGFVSVSLGPRNLRTATAALAAVARFLEGPRTPEVVEKYAAKP